MPFPTNNKLLVGSSLVSGLLIASTSVMVAQTTPAFHTFTTVHGFANSCTLSSSCQEEFIDCDMHAIRDGGGPATAYGVTAWVDGFNDCDCNSGVDAKSASGRISATAFASVSGYGLQTNTEGADARFGNYSGTSGVVVVCNSEDRDGPFDIAGD